MLALSCGVFTGPYVYVQATQQPNITAVVDEFMRAMTGHDVNRAYSLFSTRQRQFTPITVIQKLQDYQGNAIFEAYQTAQVTRWRVGWSFLGGLRARQGVTVDISGYIIYAGGEKRGFNAGFELENSEWRLSSILFDAKLSNGPTPVGAALRADPMLGVARLNQLARRRVDAAIEAGASQATYTLE